MKNYLKLGIFGLFLGAIIIASMLLPKGRGVPTFPSPNGYDDLLKAAQQVVGGPPLRFFQADEDQLKDLVARNRPALALARTGCAR
jgi:hypothetical protein